jgi:hypothetical protein
VLTLIISILVMVYLLTDMTLDGSAIDQFVTCDYVLLMIKTLKLVCCFKHLMTWLILFDPPVCRSAALCVCIGRNWMLQAYKCIGSYLIGRYMLGNGSVSDRSDIGRIAFTLLDNLLKFREKMCY